MSDIFISYSRKDIAFARILHDALKEKGLETWIDWQDIPPSAEWLAEVFQAIEAADAFVFIVSKTSINSEICSLEVSHAVKNNKRLIPIVLHDVEPKDLPESITALNWIYFRKEDEFQQSFDKLIEAIETDREWVRMHTRILVRCLEWDGRGRDKSYLLRGNDLRDALEWLDHAAGSGDQRPTKLQKDFILAGSAAARRHKRMLAGSVVLGVVVVVSLTSVAFMQRSSAGEKQNVARSRELAARSLDQLDTDPEKGLLLAIEAAQTARTSEAEEALRSSLIRSPSHVIVGEQESENTDAHLSGDGRYVLSTSIGGPAKIWDIATGEKVSELVGPYLESKFSSDGKYLAACSDLCNEIIVLNVSNGEEIGKVTGSAVATWDFSPDGKYLMVSAQDYLHVWNVQNIGDGEVLTDQNAGGLAFSPDGTRIITYGNDGSVTVRDAANLAKMSELEDSNTFVAFPSTDAKRILTLEADASANVWDTGSGKKISSMQWQSITLNGVSLSPDGDRICTAGTDGLVRLWDAASGAPLYELEKGSSGAENCVFSPDSNLLATSSLNTVSIWNVHDRQLISQLTVSGAGYLSFSPDSKMLMTAGSDGKAQIWYLNKMQVTRILYGHQAGLTDIAFSPDSRLVATGSIDKTAHLWDTSSGRSLSVLEGNEYMVLNVHFSPDSKNVITTGDDNTIRKWDVENGSAVSVIRGPACSGEACQNGNLDVIKFLKTSEKSELIWSRNSAFSSNGGLILTPGVVEDQIPRIWNADSGVQVAELAEQTGRVTGTAISPDARLAATSGNDNTARIWDVSQGKTLHILQGHGASVNSVAFSPDGQRLVTASDDNTARIWDVASGDAIVELRGHTRGIKGAVFSPDGKRILTASSDHTAKVWDAETGKLISELLGHTGEVTDAVFSFDGRWIATAADDWTARIWEAGTGRQIEIIQGHSDAIVKVAFSPDSRYLAAASKDGTASIYTCEICSSFDDLLELARSRTTRELTCDERRMYLNEEIDCSI